METKIVPLHNMESLDRLLKAEFPAIREVKPLLEIDCFEIYIDKDCNPGSEFYLTVEIGGKVQILRVLDITGNTGVYTVFNADYEKLGCFFTEEAVADFTAGHWQTDDPQLEPYLDEIIAKIGEQLEGSGGQDEVNVDDPQDLAFWAEQFDISDLELKKAVSAAGKSVDAITKYLQK